MKASLLKLSVSQWKLDSTVELVLEQGLKLKKVKFHASLLITSPHDLTFRNPAATKMAKSDQASERAHGEISARLEAANETYKSR